MISALYFFRLLKFLLAFIYSVLVFLSKDFYEAKDPIVLLFFFCPSLLLLLLLLLSNLDCNKYLELVAPLEK